MDLRGKLALVTGSTSGIGLAIAQTLAKAGSDIIVTGFGETSLIDNIKEDLSSHGVKVDYIAADLLNVKDIDLMVEEIHRRYPSGIDILINNAGFNYVQKIDEYPDVKWDALVGIHLSAPFHLIKRLLPKMKEKGWGRIVNMSSQMGLVSIQGKAVYSAVKSGLIGLTKGVALEVADKGITCNAVCPTYAMTKLTQMQIEEKTRINGTSHTEEVAKFTESVPTQRMVEVDEIADLVLYLIQSKASRQMTGANYLIDGGYTAK